MEKCSLSVPMCSLGTVPARSAAVPDPRGTVSVRGFRVTEWHLLRHSTSFKTKISLSCHAVMLVAVIR